MNVEFLLFHILSYLVNSKTIKTLPHLFEFDSMISKKVVACTAIKRNDVRKILMMGRKKRGTSCNIFSTFYNHQYTKKKAYASSVANSQYQMNFWKDFFNYFGFYISIELTTRNFLLPDYHYASIYSFKLSL